MLKTRATKRRVEDGGDSDVMAGGDGGGVQDTSCMSPSGQPHRKTRPAKQPASQPAKKSKPVKQPASQLDYKTRPVKHLASQPDHKSKAVKQTASQPDHRSKKQPANKKSKPSSQPEETLEATLSSKLSQKESCDARVTISQSDLNNASTMTVNTSQPAHNICQQSHKIKDLSPTSSNSSDTSPKSPASPSPLMSPSSLSPPCSSTQGQRLDRSFYDVDGERLARALLGQILVRSVEGVRLCARIVETEAYLGAVDKAAHSYKKQTDRNQAMFMQPGTAYVYNIYGMYCCLNISSRGAGCAVLIRSVEPIEGVKRMEELRREKMKSSLSSKAMKASHVANGPAKLCQALAISKATHNQRDLVTDKETWLERGEGVVVGRVVVSARINIGYAEDWKDKPLRFYILNNPAVSVRDRPAEQRLMSGDNTAV